MPETTAAPVLFVVDDDRGMLDFIVRVGRISGYRAEAFESGEKLLAHLDECPDVIVLDMTMPGLDGIQVIQALAARGYAGRLIIASGFFSDVVRAAEALARGKKLNLVGTLAKPFVAAQLQELLAMPGPKIDAA
jgi:FixJ family two-component response regulator